jgi:hypothetical protein
LYQHYLVNTRKRTYCTIVLTDDEGKGSEDLWRDVSAVPSGSLFDIHFRVIDAQTQEVVLTSDCYKYEVR